MHLLLPRGGSSFLTQDSIVFELRQILEEIFGDHIGSEATCVTLVVFVCICGEQKTAC